MIGKLLYGIWSQNFLEIEENWPHSVFAALGQKLKAGSPRETKLSLSGGLPLIAFQMVRSDHCLGCALLSVVSFLSKHHGGYQELCGNLQ